MTARATLPRRDLIHPDGRAFHVYGHQDDWDLAAASGTPFDPTELHRRLDRLTDSWVLVSPARNVRPSATTSGAQDPACPLCPGGAELPGPYDVAVFDNRYPAVVDAPTQDDCDERRAPARGRALVVAHTDRHVVRTGDLSAVQLAAVMAVLREHTTALWRDGWAYVMAFENHGSEVGATLPHQHGQVYALDHIPPIIAAKRVALERHRGHAGTCLGCTLVSEDLTSDRVVEAGEHFVAAVPFAARWPYAVEVRARHHGTGRLGDLSDDAALELARLLAAMLDRFDGLWGFDLPYMLCVQEAPAADDDAASPAPDWHLHVELLPPHRNPSRLKVRASVETTLGVFINDTLPERTAAELRATTGRRRDWTDVVLPTIEAAP